MTLLLLCVHISTLVWARCQHCTYIQNWAQCLMENQRMVKMLSPVLSCHLYEELILILLRFLCVMMEWLSSLTLLQASFIYMFDWKMNKKMGRVELSTILLECLQIFLSSCGSGLCTFAYKNINLDLTKISWNLETKRKEESTILLSNTSLCDKYMGVCVHWMEQGGVGGC